ncbi:MAG TPA: endonuclease [Bacteroidales bacterium]|nr:endonuclease [Bacteroidales bacterium]
MKKMLILWVALLIGLAVKGQIPPGYYDGTEGLYGEALKAALHGIIDEHDAPSYDDLRDFILPESDEDPQNPDNVILLYTGRSQAKNTFGGLPDQWNREHVWAKSHGGFDNDPPCGTDAHMIRPTDVSVNADRGNKDFDEGGQQHSEATGCYYTAYTWEPRDEVKGDVARMILYMDVRYEGDNGEPDLTVVDAVNTAPAPEHGRLSTLLDWHEEDPPDAFEINRNNVVYYYQGNRNPFIDHPEFVYDIWGASAGVKEVHTAPQFSLYPNPAADHLHVVINNKQEGSFMIEIYDIRGNSRVVEQASGAGLIVESNELQPGLYFIRVRDEQSMQSNVSSFIKVR